MGLLLFFFLLFVVVVVVFFVCLFVILGSFEGRKRKATRERIIRFVQQKSIPVRSCKLV